MDNDELRDAARLLAVTQTLRAVIDHIAEQDEDEAGRILSRAGVMIDTAPHVTPEVARAAKEICRRELFKPLN